MFQKGTPKTGGRKKGTPNKTTAQFRDAVKKFLNDNWGTLQDDFEAMEPYQRVTFRDRLLRYVLPEALNPEKLTEQQLMELYEFIKAQNEEKGD